MASENPDGADDAAGELSDGPLEINEEIGILDATPYEWLSFYANFDVKQVVTFKLPYDDLYCVAGLFQGANYPWSPYYAYAHVLMLWYIEGDSSDPDYGNVLPYSYIIDVDGSATPSTNLIADLDACNDNYSASNKYGYLAYVKGYDRKKIYVAKIYTTGMLWRKLLTKYNFYQFPDTALYSPSVSVGSDGPVVFARPPSCQLGSVFLDPSDGDVLNATTCWPGEGSMDPMLIDSAWQSYVNEFFVTVTLKTGSTWWYMWNFAADEEGTLDCEYNFDYIADAGPYAEKPDSLFVTYTNNTNNSYYRYLIATNKYVYWIDPDRTLTDDTYNPYQINGLKALCEDWQPSPWTKHIGYAWYHYIRMNPPAWGSASKRFRNYPYPPDTGDGLSQLMARSCTASETFTDAEMIVAGFVSGDDGITATLVQY